MNDRPVDVILTETAAYLAYLATEALYTEQPDLWELGERGRFHTLNDFTLHFQAVANGANGFAAHVAYSRELFADKGYPEKWLTDAWGNMSDGFAAVSDISIDEVGSDALIRAFEQRLGEVDRWPGFRRLEVWQSERDRTQFVMVSWWDDQDSFRAYMRSDAHDRSHARIPTEPARPKPVGFRRYRIVAR